MTFSVADVFSSAGLVVLGQVIAIDLMLAGDNIVILGTLAAGLPDQRRRRVLAIGIGAALIFLIVFAWFAVRLLKVVGLLFAGGLLLVWVAWRLWRDLRAQRRAVSEHAPASHHGLLRASLQIALADLSMSLDNVLAVAGAARNHPSVLIVGLVLSVTMMAVAANYIARIIIRYRWIAWIGLAIVVYVGGTMIYQGIVDPTIGIGRWLR